MANEDAANAEDADVGEANVEVASRAEASAVGPLVVVAEVVTGGMMFHGTVRHFGCR